MGEISMGCGVEAIPRYTEADADEDEEGWADEDDLPEDAHWDDECLAAPSNWAGVPLGEAIRELHGQAHAGPLRLCQSEPCRRLDLGQLALIG